MPQFLGIPLGDLEINSVSWTDEQAEHTRRGTGWRPEPEMATEAALDTKRVVRVASAGSIKVVGWSPSAKRLVKVWLYPADLQAGDWLGLSGSEANSSDRRRYEETP